MFGGCSSSIQPTQQPDVTTIKFDAVCDQDTITKNGRSKTKTINTLHQCITAMKQYENKSIEELRWEDYKANLNTPIQTTTSSLGSPKLVSLIGAAKPAAITTTSFVGDTTTQPATTSLFNDATSYATSNKTSESEPRPAAQPAFGFNNRITVSY